MLPPTWPSFQIEQVKPNTTRCIGWSAHYFFPGSYDESGYSFYSSPTCAHFVDALVRLVGFMPAPGT